MTTRVWICRCSHDGSLAVSEACIPLVTCQEAAPLIGTLLQQPASCIRAAVSEDFLDALNSAHSRYAAAHDQLRSFNLLTRVLH